MKRLIPGLLMTAFFVSSLVFANGKINKKHLNKTGKDGAKINCVYCHKSPGANIPKKKGQDINALYKTPYCSGQGCHK